jgi:urocanate hydratase
MVAREKGIRIPIIDKLENKSARVIEEAYREDRISKFTYDRVKKDLQEYEERKKNYRTPFNT